MIPARSSFPNALQAQSYFTTRIIAVTNFAKDLFDEWEERLFGADVVHSSPKEMPNSRADKMMSESRGTFFVLLMALSSGTVTMRAAR